MAATWKQRLDETTGQRGRLCVGIDPSPKVLDAWALPNDVSGLERCARTVVEVLGPKTAVFKPQSAFFEPFGSAGIAVLERVLADISAAGALSLLDVKRGDIGSSMEGYASAYLDDDSPLAADAITLSPFLGVGSLMPAIEKAVDTGRGIYVLARTSNPDGDSIQLAQLGKTNVAQHVIDTIAARNHNWDHAVGLVVGATHSRPGCRVSDFNGSILVPGIGAQGGTIDDVLRIFGAAVAQVLPTASREVMGHGAGELESRFDVLQAQTALLG